MRLIIISLLMVITTSLSGKCKLYNHHDYDKLNYVYQFFLNTKYAPVAKVITAMGVQESGWFSNPKHVRYNNYFSIKDFSKCCEGSVCKPIQCLARNKSLEESCKHMLNYLTRKEYPTDERGFYKHLVKKKYSELLNEYVVEVKKVVKSIECRGLFNRGRYG